MIAIDRREGSAHLVALMPPGVATLTTLPFGDACWYGTGPAGVRVRVGVECKRVGDLLACLRDCRFSGFQLPGMLLAYEYTYLLVEGVVRPHPKSGYLQEWHAYKNGEYGKWRTVALGGTSYCMYSAWEQHLETLRRKTPLRVVHTTSPRHTAQTLLVLYKWWTDGKGWDQHRSHEGVHVLPDPHVRVLALPTYRRTVLKVAQQLPGVRDVLAERVAAQFATVAEMVQAKAQTWAMVDGIGPVKAAAIVAALHGPGAANK